MPLVFNGILLQRQRALRVAARACACGVAAFPSLLRPAADAPLANVILMGIAWVWAGCPTDLTRRAIILGQVQVGTSPIAGQTIRPRAMAMAMAGRGISLLLPKIRLNSPAKSG